MFPEFAPEFDLRRKLLSDALDEAQAAWMTHKHAQDQKTFALAVKHLPLSALLFQMRKNAYLGGVRGYLSQIDPADSARFMENRFEDRARGQMARNRLGGEG